MLWQNDFTLNSNKPTRIKLQQDSFSEGGKNLIFLKEALANGDVFFHAKFPEQKYYIKKFVSRSLRGVKKYHYERVDGFSVVTLDTERLIKNALIIRKGEMFTCS